jgi:hypothetical protein
MRTLVGIANPDQLTALRKLLDEYAAAHGLTDEAALQRLADRILMLFNEGITDAIEIRRRLDSSRASL